MKTVGDVGELRDLVRSARAAGKRVGFAPTMGALHEGHLSLVRRARGECGFIVVSIFVNPLQFAPNEDFDRYPRRPEEDARLLEAAGVDVLYRPNPASFYPPGFSTTVDVADVSEGGEGRMRPGHFRGVATVVARLFAQVAPDIAYFGRKDLQQVAVIRRMARDLDLPITIVACETVRDADGLALSSRNAYLSIQDRQRALALPRALFAARELACGGQCDPSLLESATRSALEEAGLRVDYVEVVDAETMHRPERIGPRTAIAAAVRVGQTRLIDNVRLVEE